MDQLTYRLTLRITAQLEPFAILRGDFVNRTDERRRLQTREQPRTTCARAVVCAAAAAQSQTVRAPALARSRGRSDGRYAARASQTRPPRMPSIQARARPPSWRRCRSTRPLPCQSPRRGARPRRSRLASAKPRSRLRWRVLGWRKARPPYPKGRNRAPAENDQCDTSLQSRSRTPPF
eukprot:2086440-Pleurochrysis_carterae.AAC.1